MEGQADGAGPEGQREGGGPAAQDDGVPPQVDDGDAVAVGDREDAAVGGNNADVMTDKGPVAAPNADKNAADGANKDGNKSGGKASKGGKKTQPMMREPYSLRAGPRGNLFSEVAPPTTRRKGSVNAGEFFEITAQVNAPPRGQRTQSLVDGTNRRGEERPADGVDEHHVDDVVVVADPAGGAGRANEAAVVGDREQVDGTGDRAAVHEVDVHAANEAEIAALEEAARQALERTAAEAARRVAELDLDQGGGADPVDSGERGADQPGNRGEDELNALYDGVGSDAKDDDRRERANRDGGGFADDTLLPDEEDEEEDKSVDSQQEVKAAQAELYAEIIRNISMAKAVFVDDFHSEQYPIERAENLLKDVRLFQSAVVKMCVALALGREAHFRAFIDRLALRDIREIYSMGPKKLRPVIRRFYGYLDVDQELKYELIAALKGGEAAAVAARVIYNETCAALSMQDEFDVDSELSYVTEESKASAMLRQRDRLVGALKKSVQDEADLVTRLSLNRGLDESQVQDIDDQLVEVRKERNRATRIYKHGLINRWRNRDAEKVGKATGAPAPVQTPRERLTASVGESRREDRGMDRPRGGQDKPAESDEVSAGASTVVEDFGLRGGPEPQKRVRLTEDTPEWYRYTPEGRKDRQEPLSSTRMRSQETSLNTSGFSQGIRTGGRARIRRPSMEAGSEAGSSRGDRNDPPRPTREDAERSLNEAMSAREVLEALKLTAQISMSQQRDNYGMEYVETAVIDKDRWYLSLPKPWNVVPNKTAKYTDEMHKIRFLLQKADTAGSQLRLFNGNEADYFDWRPVVIHGIHKKNVSIADKFYALLAAFKRNEDAFVDSLVRDQDPSPEAYEHILVQLERQYGGERRAYTHAAMVLKYKVKLDADNQETVSDVYAEVRRYISFCRKNNMELYLQPGPTASELIRRFMAPKQISNMVKYCDLQGIREEAGSLHQVEAYLAHLLDNFAKEQEITGIQRLPSSRRGGGGRGQQYPNQYGRGQARGAYNTSGQNTSYRYGGYGSSNYRGSRGFGNRGIRGGRGGYQTNYNRNVFTFGDSSHEGATGEYSEEDGTYNSEEEQVENPGMEQGDLENWYEYPSDDEDLMVDHAVHNGNTRYFVDKEPFGDADEYRVFAQAIAHEVKECSLCEKKLQKKEKHLLFLCPIFKAMTLKEKCGLLQDEERCFNCLAKGHGSRTCQSKRRCVSCQKAHHSLICIKAAKPGKDVSFIKEKVKAAENRRNNTSGSGGKLTRQVTFRGRKP